MATETPEQSASLAEVSRSFFTDPTGLPHSKDEDTGSSQTSRMCVKTRRIREPPGSDGETYSSQPVNQHQNHWKEVIVERRLYFLLPDVAHARAVVAKLEANGIERNNTHVIAAKGIDLEDLPLASPNQRMDLGARLETIFWYGNLVLFFLALLALVVLMLMNVSGLWLVLASTIMLVTFVAGAGFANYIPNVHLFEFADALRHQEILLMVDVPVGQVARVETLVHHNHPEAINGGVGWHINALQI